jgi:hypothetical protein
VAVIGLDAHQDVNRGHDESLDDPRMFDELRATLSAGGPPQSQLDPPPDIPGIQFARANITAGAVSLAVCDVSRNEPRLYEHDAQPPAGSLIGSA